MKNLFVILAILASGTAQAKSRSGNVSFGGLQVKVSVDSDHGVFQIGESLFQSEVRLSGGGRFMTASKRVGIMTWIETLSATIFIDGGTGGDPREYKCENARIKIIRTDDQGHVTELKNECAYFN
jgi:hypothetical protein